MAVPCQCGPQKVIVAFEKLFLFWVLMTIQKDWKAKLESPYYLMLKNSKITVWMMYQSPSSKRVMTIIGQDFEIPTIVSGAF